MENEQDDVREKIRLALEEGQRAMAESEQMHVDMTKLREQVRLEKERKLPKVDDERPKG